jgi:hypothetical protein
LTKSTDVKKELEMKKFEILTGNVSRLLLIVFFIVPGVSLFSLNISGTNWYAGYYNSIQFGTDKHFSISTYETSAEGTYSQTGNDITLNYTSGFEAGVGNKLSILETDDIMGMYKLVCSGGMEFISRARPPQGSKRKANGIVAYVYDAQGVVNENTLAREGPGLQYNSLPVGGLDGGYVTIVGRSENQAMLNGVNAYWYYCCWSVYGGKEYGWIWGGSIDFKK